MKQVLGILVMVVLSVNSFGQKVNWSFSSLKKSGGLYQVMSTATVPSGWHIYSSTTPEGGPVPTTFTFSKKPSCADEREG